MDSRLLKAAQLGDAASPRALLAIDPLILERSVLTPTAETPLHIASLSENPDFVHEIIRQKPSFAWELNQDGFSPLHIAVAVGNKDVVLELLILGSDLCLLKDKQGLIALHYAAIKGRVAIIQELVRCCPESLKERATRGQTVLHLAVKNCQFEALRTLVEKLDDEEVKDFVNAEDDDRNTIHQMAVASKQVEVLRYLEKHAELGMKSLEITCADGDELEKGSDAPPQGKQPSQHEETWKPSRDSVLIAASVIATVTFQGIIPPETMFKNDVGLAKNCTIRNVLKLEGHNPKYHSPCPGSVQYFFISMSFNTADFFAATMVLLPSPFRRSVGDMILVSLAVGCMMLSYLNQLRAMYPHDTLLLIYALSILIFLLFAVYPSLLGLSVWLAINKFIDMKKKIVMKMTKPSSTDTSNVEA